MRYVLGLDIGIASVGWAVLNLDGKRVEDLGVRAFNAAEDPKTRAPLAEPRRIARCARRRLCRRAGRLRRAKDLFVHYGLMHEQDRATAFETAQDKPSPWELRVKGLDKALTGEEFARALFHIVKRRGFKSNRKKAKAAEDGKMLSGIGGNRQLMEQHGYRTAGEMFSRDDKFAERKRNSTDSYDNTVDRETLKDEISTLFDRQRALGSRYASPEFESAFLDVFAWQKPFASGDDILRLIGRCTFEPGELRAAKHSYHAERSSLLQKINSLSYTRNGDRLPLTEEERAKVVELLYSKSKVIYAQVRKALALPDDARFTGLTYLRRPAKDADLEESLDCEKTTFFPLVGYHALRAPCEPAGVWEQVRSDPDLMDDLAYALTFYKTDEDMMVYLRERGVAEAVIEAVLKCDGFTKTANLSIKAAKKILPYLEQGFLYSDACAKAGYDHSRPAGSEKLTKLPVNPSDLTTNPVVRRSLAQARKVVNAVINRYGSPYRIHIELARDMGKGLEKRKEIEARQKENRAESERLKEHFQELFGRVPSGTDLLKWRLYSEQTGQCAYSLTPIQLERLFEPGYAEIDHVIPYSRSFDDGRSNKVLALATENQKKKNQIPYEIFGHDTTRWNEFEAWVRASVRDPRKRNNLLRMSFDQRQEEEWKKRSLSDTRYISTEFSQFVRENLKFADPNVQKPVVCVNGQITARARWLWGLEKSREENDLHHALDAAVVAAISDHQIKLITEHSKVEETGEKFIDPETGEIIERTSDHRPKLPFPWKKFRQEIEARLSDDPEAAIGQLELDSYQGAANLRPVIVSRMPIRKMTGAIHAETIRSLKKDGTSTVRKRLVELTKDDLDKLYAPETNEKLYDAIRQRMAEFDCDAKKAFAEPLRKPTNDGSDGPIVKSVKVWKIQNTGIPVRGGIADNDSIVRTDVFTKDGKYYLVPVYVAQVMSGKLPDRAIAAGKPESEWPVMDGYYAFLFSLYPYDMIRIKTRKEDFLGYYRSTHRNKGALTVCPCNDAKSEVTRDIRVKTAELIEKFEMGILGDYYPVRGEVRRGLENRGNLESGEAES